jgi:predicted DNA-binding transcriptional regulator AlpA
MTDTSPAAAVLVSALMDSREVAGYLKVSESTLSRWRTDKKGPPYLRLGGIARYRLDSVDAWLASLELHEHR